MLSPRWWMRASGWEWAHRLCKKSRAHRSAGRVRRRSWRRTRAASGGCLRGSHGCRGQEAVHLEVQAMVAALRKFGGLAAAVCLAKSLKPFILAAPFQIRNRLCMAFRTPTLLIMPQDRTPRRQAHNLLCPVLLHVWIAFVV